MLLGTKLIGQQLPSSPVESVRPSWMNLQCTSITQNIKEQYSLGVYLTFRKVTRPVT